MTIIDVAEQTGISKSTLSRLETGQRRPTLELLLPLAQVYRVPLDELVGAPDVGDPRIRLKPREANGRTVLPLTRNPNGVQAWKIVIPTSQSTPKLRAHDGYEWLYVLSGRMRLIIGDADMVLGVGEVAEFETSESHWFGSTGDEPAEVLTFSGGPESACMFVRPQIDGWRKTDRAALVAVVHRSVVPFLNVAGPSTGWCARVSPASSAESEGHRYQAQQIPPDADLPPQRPGAQVTHTARPSAAAVTSNTAPVRRAGWRPIRRPGVRGEDVEPRLQGREGLGPVDREAEDDERRDGVEGGDVAGTSHGWPRSSP